MLAVEIWICFPEILQPLTIPDVPESMGSLIIFFFPENKPLCPCSSHRGLWKKTDDLTLLHQIYLLSPKSLLLPFQVADSSQWVSLMGSGGGIGCSTYHPYPSPGTLVVTSFIFTSHLLLCSIPYPLSF